MQNIVVNIMQKNRKKDVSKNERGCKHNKNGHFFQNQNRQ